MNTQRAVVASRYARNKDYGRGNLDFTTRVTQADLDAVKNAPRILMPQIKSKESILPPIKEVVATKRHYLWKEAPQEIKEAIEALVSLADISTSRLFVSLLCIDFRNFVREKGSMVGEINLEEIFPNGSNHFSFKLNMTEQKEKSKKKITIFVSMTTADLRGLLSLRKA